MKYANQVCSGIFLMAIMLAVFSAVIVLSSCNGRSGYKYGLWPSRGVLFQGLTSIEGIAPFSVEFDLWINNNESIAGFLKSIQIDFDDGNGFVEIAISCKYEDHLYSHQLQKTYLSPGSYYPKLKVVYLDGEERSKQFQYPITVLPKEGS